MARLLEQGPGVDSEEAVVASSRIPLSRLPWLRWRGLSGSAGLAPDDARPSKVAGGSLVQSFAFAFNISLFSLSFGNNFWSYYLTYE